jgi:hypothetical protein
MYLECDKLSHPLLPNVYVTYNALLSYFILFINFAFKFFFDFSIKPLINIFVYLGHLYISFNPISFPVLFNIFIIFSYFSFLLHEINLSTLQEFKG